MALLSAPSLQKSPPTLPFLPFRKLSLSLMFFSLKELKILCTSMCFDCLHMAHGVITRVSTQKSLHLLVDFLMGDASRLPHLVPDQVLKLKQLTVLTLAETNKVLPYHQLMQELDVINVQELEDFLINECMYAGIIRGKLDQLQKCFELQFAAGRDPRPGQLGSMIQTLSNWLDTSSNLLISIQEKMKWADTMTEVAKEHKKEVGNRVEEVKKSISIKADVDFRGHEEIYSEPGGVMDYEEDRSRPKRRRHPIYKS
nr:COP9 signalosome complex subunit 7-like isoform X9 [Malus domestica]